MSKRGRPKKENARDRGYRIRLTNEEFELLNKMSDKLDIQKSEIIRNSLRIYNNLIAKVD